jgi:hypothetical protein
MFSLAMDSLPPELRRACSVLQFVPAYNVIFR